MSDYDKRLFAYQMAMALARSMHSKGLIYRAFRGNM